MSLQRIVIDTGNLTADGFKSVCDLSPGQLPALQNLVNYLSSVPDQQSASLSIKVGAVLATGLVEFASTGPTNGQTCTIAGVTVTAVTSGTPSANQFTRSNTPSVNAVNLAAAINASSSFAGIVTAVRSGDTVILSCAVPGKVGNGIVAANVNLSNSTITSFANGSDGTSYSLALS